MQRRAAIAANFLLRALDAQPMPARGTSRTQTLHRRTRQILHRSPRFVSGPSAAANPKCPRRDARIPERMRDCERGGLVCQEKSILLVVVQFRNGKKFILGWKCAASLPASYGRIWLGATLTGGPCMQTEVFLRHALLRQRLWLADGLHEEARHKARALRSEGAPRRSGLLGWRAGIGMAPGGTGFGGVAGFVSGAFAGGAPIFA